MLIEPLETSDKDLYYEIYRIVCVYRARILIAQTIVIIGPFQIKRKEPNMTIQI